MTQIENTNKAKKKDKRGSPIPYRPPKALEEEFNRLVQSSGLSTCAFITYCVFNKKFPRQVNEKKSLALMLHGLQPYGTG